MFSRFIQSSDESRPEIRLLDIVSSGADANPECKLSVASLEDKPKFTALSYIWGDASITEDILLNGCSISLRANLAAALRHVKGHWQATICGPRS